MMTGIHINKRVYVNKKIITASKPLFKPIRNRLLIPLFATLLFLIVGFSTVIITLQQKNLNKLAMHIIEEASDDLVGIINKNSDMLHLLTTVEDDHQDESGYSEVHMSCLLKFFQLLADPVLSIYQGIKTARFCLKIENLETVLS